MSTLQTTILKHPDSAASQITFTSGGDIDFDSGAAYIDSSNNRVGIGTISPQHVLDVRGNNNPQIKVSEVNNSTSAGLYIENQGQRNWQIWADRSTDQFRVGNNDRASTNFAIDSSGRVGIGVSSLSSSSRLTLLESAGNAQTLEIKGANTGGVGSQPGIKFTASTGDNIGGIFGDTNTDSVIFQSGGNPAMRIDSSGRVGIGVTSVNAVRAVEIKQPNGYVAGLRIMQDGSGAYNQFFSGTSNWRVGSPQLTNALTFDQGSTASEAMRIVSAGQISIGTTTSTAKLSIWENASVNEPVRINDTNNTNGLTHRISFRTGDVEAGKIISNRTSTSLVSGSDYRLKENVVDIADGISRVKQLLPKRFNFIVNADETVDGFIAHEAQAVVPEAVTGTYNEVDNDGKAVMQCMDQSKFVPLLTAALQEAIAKIETLEQRLSDAGIA
jgi:hypothetical protein